MSNFTTTATTTNTSPPRNSARPISIVCPQCNYDLTDHDSASAAQHRLLELQEEVKLLSNKASAAVDKLADYEDEIRYLRSQNQTLTQQVQQHATTPSPQRNGATSSPGRTISPPTTTATRLATLTSYFPGRRPSPLPSITTTTASTNDAHAAPTLASPAFPRSPGFPPPQHQPSSSSSSLPTDITTLQTALSTERAARAKLESQLSSTSGEIEDLTAQLFGQANEMVATERRQKAKLEERLKDLEAKWDERRARLERLEGRVVRGERVRSLLREVEGVERGPEKEKDEGSA